MRLGLVVFDCDGVLVDSERVANATLAAMVTDLGLPMTTEQSMRTFMGRTLSACESLLGEMLGRPAPADFMPELERRTLAAFERELEPVEGIHEALAEIDAFGLPTCVASSGSVAKMQRTLELTDLYDRFAGRIYSATDVPRGKPHPDVFLHAAAAMGVDPPGCLVVEDSVLGVEAGRAARMDVLGFARETSPAALRGAGARVFDDMADLPGLIAARLEDGRAAPARS